MPAKDLIQHFGLVSHPEGGHYTRTYCSDICIPHQTLPARFHGDRPFSTAIFFLLEKGERSKFHRIASDEVWHFYLGGPLEVIEISSDGIAKTTLLGQDFLNGQQLQYTVKAGNWFGARPAAGTAYSFVGCTVAPGFNFSDFEMADRAQLLSLYPHAKSIINEMTD